MSVQASSGPPTADGRASVHEAPGHADGRALRRLTVSLALGWSAAFVAVALVFRLQMFADGSIFSYAVAVQDAWAFHWSNISGRVLGYLYAYVPAEAYVGLTGDPLGGVALYGFLHYAAALIGLALTWAADRSPGRVFFAWAALSTAAVCPLVFGFPTEMWLAHALFWPALAACHAGRSGLGGFLAVLAALVALVLTHEGAVIFAVAILVTLAPRGLRNPALWRTAAALVLALAIWAAVKATWRPDAYVGGVLDRNAMNFINLASLACPLVLLLAGALGGYGALALALRRQWPERAHWVAAAAVALALGGYWLWLDRWLHGWDRYYLRTLLLAVTPILGAVAAARVLDLEGRMRLPIPLLPKLLAWLAGASAARLGVGALLLVTLIHVVETAKFTATWTRYTAAVRALATGTASDPALGDAAFASSERIDAALNRLSWNSTTPYLSVLLAPGLAPSRLVVDPAAGYFWLSCANASANLAAERAVPHESRRLVTAHACLHR